jgi:hypothetical protein
MAARSEEGGNASGSRRLGAGLAGAVGSYEVPVSTL